MTDEDPVAHASAQVMSWASVASVAAEAFAQMAASRAREKTERDRTRAQMLRAERHARYARDSVHWQPVLDPQRYPTSTVKEAGLAWASAQSWHGDPQADWTVGLAENRLQELRPDVMRLYHLHVADGLDPIVAMGRVADLMDRPPAYPAETDRPELVTPFTAGDAVQQSFPTTCVECLGVDGHRETCSERMIEDPYRDRLLSACRDAERWFRYQLDGSWVPEYLTGRRLDGCLGPSSPWAVGYAPNSWTALTEHLRNKDYSEQELLDAGLSSRSKRGTLVDRFRDRLMVSVRDSDDLTVGFVGRANPETTSQRVPKYLNSPETVLYKKSDLMLGLAEQAAELRLGARPVVVEGAFDAMALTEAGEGRYVGVAPSGTAVTASQMRELRKVTREGAVFAMDGDMAGRQAVVRAHAAAHRAGFTDLRAAVLPAGCDPADLWRGGRVTPLTQALDRAQPMADLVVDARLDEWPHGFSSYPERVNAARSAATVIVELPADDRARQVGRVAERLRLDVTVVTDAVTDATGRDGIVPPAARSRAPADLSR